MRHRARVLAGACLFTLLSAYWAHKALTHIDVNLFNQASGALKRFGILRELSEDFGGDLLAGVVSIPEKHSPEQRQELKEFGDLLTVELAKAGTRDEDRAELSAALQGEFQAGTPWLRFVECRTGQGIEAALKKIGERRVFVFLSPADIAELKKLFEPDALKQAMDRVASDVSDFPANSPQIVKDREDPLGIAALAQRALHERTQKQKQALSQGGSDGYFISPDGTTLLVLARAAMPAGRLDFTRALMHSVQRAENRAILEFRKRSPTLSSALKGNTYGELAANEKPGSLSVGYTGMAAVSIENEMTLKADMRNNTLSSLLFVLILFAVAFRSIWLTSDVLWTTLLTIIWTVAFAGLSKGSISLLGGAFTAVPVGLGTDYTILIYNTFHRLRESGELSREEAMQIALSRCGPSVLTASFITTIAFFGVGFTHLSGLAEFGILGGVSAIFGALIMLLVYPAALCRSRKTLRIIKQPLGLGIPAWGRLLSRPAAQIAGITLGLVALLATGVLIIFGPDPGPETVAGVRFDPDLGNLHSIKIKAIPLRERLTQKFGIGLSDLRVIVDAADEEHAFAGADEVSRRMKSFVDAGEVTALSGAADFIPSPARQRETIQTLKEVDFGQMTLAFREAVKERFGERGAAFFRPFLKRLQDIQLAAPRTNILTLTDVMKGPLGNLMASFVKLDFDNEQGEPPPQAGKGDGDDNEEDAPRAATKVGKLKRVRLVSSWLPARNDYSAAWYNKVAAALEENPPQGVQIRVFSPRMIGFELKEVTLHDCAWITLAVAAAVCVALAIALRSLTNSLLAAVPLIFACAALLAGVPISQMMGWDFSLNFVNLIMFPLLLGSAIDYGVYVVFEASSVRKPAMPELMAYTGRSVFYCMATTLIGFGSFVTSSYTGLVSMGKASLFGYTGAVFGALIVLPAVIGLLRGKEESRIEK